jgi:hypothetical protein
MRTTSLSVFELNGFVSAALCVPDKRMHVVTRARRDLSLTAIKELGLLLVVGSWDLNRPGCNAVRGRTLTTQTSNLD